MNGEKAAVCTCISNVCKANGWNTEENVKTPKWKADVVVEYGTYKVAFNVCKSPRKVEETYQAMRREKVCGCWLLLPSEKSWFVDKNLPCFYLMGTDSESVYLEPPYLDGKRAFELTDFTTSIVKGNIRWTDKMQVRYADVCFIDEACWKCGTANHVYFVSRLYSDDGIEVNVLNYHDESSDITFNPQVINAVHTHIANHPELGIRLGTIKPRYSRTVNDTYMSFGCIRCDSLFGEYFIRDAIMDYCDALDELTRIRIDVGDAGIVIPARCWYRRK